LPVRSLNFVPLMVVETWFEIVIVAEADWGDVTLLALTVAVLFNKLPALSVALLHPPIWTHEPPLIISPTKLPPRLKL